VKTRCNRQSYHNSFTRQARNARHGDDTVSTVRFDDVEKVTVRDMGNEYEVVVKLPDGKFVMYVNPPDYLHEQLVDMGEIEP